MSTLKAKPMQVKPDKILKELQKSKYLKLFPDFKAENTQKITYIALTLIALSLFGLFAINPTISTIVKLQKELKDNKLVDKSLQEKITNLDILQQKYSRIQGDLPQIYAAIPTNPNAALLMAEIQSIAESSGLTIASAQVFSVDSDSGKKQYSVFNFSVAGTGNFENISNFIEKLSTMRRITNQNIISITKQSGKDSSLLLNIKGETYFKKL
jgi:Tfp pilus assembly protein PilO